MKTKKIFLTTMLAILFAAFSISSGAQTSTGKTAALQTIGMQGGLVLYQTYQLIGAMNDGYINKAWEAKTVTDIMDEQVTMLDNMTAQYNTLLASKFLTDPSDTATVHEMMRGIQYLKDEAKGLHDMVTDNSDDAKKEYNTARDESWKIIADVLGLKDGN
ncbi:MAG: hypothetical protein HY064_09635 [Bacteroidetes bacterium]|nr:hypothetical protein [Bacteroidota bacterium]